MEPPTAIGAPIMAVGIFITASLRHLPGGSVWTRLLSILLGLVWISGAVLLLRSIRRYGLSVHTKPVVASFGIGTWVAATAILARAVMLAGPGPGWLPKGFLVVTLILWLGFIPLAIKNLLRLFAETGLRPNGVILLTTVATQAVALLALRLFPGPSAVRWAAAGLMAAGAVCYLAGLCLILRRYVFNKDWTLALDWDNSNCILHGAVSISGLTAVISGFVAVSGILALWALDLVLLAGVETIEVTRLVARVRAMGWRYGALEYHVSQWARNFTFGMFYAFTLAFSQRFEIGQRHPLLGALRTDIVAHGQYVVLILLLTELFLLASSHRHSARK